MIEYNAEVTDVTITYELGNSLYVNITNRCSNDCSFCVRNEHDGVNGKDSLWLDREPEIDEIRRILKSATFQNMTRLCSAATVSR